MAGSRAGTAMVEFLFGRGVLVTGIEQDPDEPTMDRVYVGPRYYWRYVLVDHDSMHTNAMAHTITTLPEDIAIYQDREHCPAAYLRPIEEHDQR
jgi:hypothetical protein